MNEATSPNTTSAATGEAAQRENMHKMLDGMKDNSMTLQDLARMSREEREKWWAENPTKPHNWRDDLPKLKPEQVVRFATDAAHELTSELYDGLKILEALGGDDESVEIDPDALKWLAGKFKGDAGDIMNHLDYAQSARKGHVYDDAGEMYRRAYETEAGR